MTRKPQLSPVLGAPYEHSRRPHQGKGQTPTTRRSTSKLARFKQIDHHLTVRVDLSIVDGMCMSPGEAEYLLQREARTLPRRRSVRRGGGLDSAQLSVTRSSSPARF
jgi:hypothetical protein